MVDDERIAKLEERVENWMESTTEYRKALCAKLDIVLQKLNALPCDRGEEHSKHVDHQLTYIWSIITFCVVGLLSLAVCWGAVNNQVEVNTGRWERYFQVHPDTK